MNPLYPDLPVLGIDVSKLTFDASLLCSNGTKPTAQFSNDDKGFAKLDAWLKTHQSPKTLGGLEATGSYSLKLLQHLQSTGHVACQLNPRRVKDYGRSQGRRIKTDRTDATLIASYLKTSEKITPWQPPTQAQSDLQALVRRRQDVLKALQAERNRLEGAPSSKAVKASLQRQIKHLEVEATVISKDIKSLLLENDEVQKDERLLRSIDGVGPIVSVTFLAEIPSIKAFERARDLAAFVGLTPSLAESGTSVKKRGRMSREGGALLRKMLYMAALQAVQRKNNAFHKLYLNFVERGKAKMCALGAVMHKILRVIFGVLKHKTNFAANLAKLPA